MSNRINNYLLEIYIEIILLLGGLIGFQAQAGVIEQSEDITNPLQDASREAGFHISNPGGSLILPSVVATIIKSFLGLLGVIFIGLIIYGGYEWMTAAGEEQKVTKAKDTLRWAVIGLIIIMASYAISYFVFNALDETIG